MIINNCILAPSSRLDSRHHQEEFKISLSTPKLSFSYILDIPDNSNFLYANIFLGLKKVRQKKWEISRQNSVNLCVLVGVSF